MSALEALQSVQYVTAKGQRFAVVGLDAWETLIEWLETQEDVAIAHHFLSQLKMAGRAPEKAGWLRWEDIREEVG